MAGSEGQGDVRIDGFKILETLGRGGMGTVYKALQEDPARVVALKVLHPELAEDGEYVKRFLREVRAAAMLDHGNIIAGYGVGECEGLYYFAMEYVDGRTLDELLREEGPLGEERALTVALEIAAALAHVSENRLVHQDIKPGNIMIASTGEAKLCDLGLARQCSVFGDKTAIGTPRYIAPEQARGIPDVDTRADIYSLGATLFTMVTGAPPFEGTTSKVLTESLAGRTRSPRSVRKEVSFSSSRLIERMMAQRREDRPQTPAEVVDAIRNILYELAAERDVMSFDDLESLPLIPEADDGAEVPYAVLIVEPGAEPTTQAVVL